VSLEFGLSMPQNKLTPLSVEEIEQYKALPVLTKTQVARVLQIPESTVLQLSRRRAKHRLPVFRIGRGIGSTFAMIDRWLQERQAEAMPPQRFRRVA
jgi:hypothetical protein